MAHVKYTEDNVPYTSNDWHIADVESVCEQMDVTLTEDEKEEVLHIVADSFDANYGLAWDNFEWAIQDIIDGRKNEDGTPYLSEFTNYGSKNDA